MKTSELDGVRLDWAVTTIEEPDALRFGVADWREQRWHKTTSSGEYVHRYHQTWSQGGPIIERERITCGPWTTSPYMAHYGTHDTVNSKNVRMTGPTPLIAAMRCFVASRLGDEVEVPEELK
jgi:hypothetical protein